MIELEHLNIENSGTAGTVRSLTRKGLATVPQHHNTYRRWNMLDDEYLRQRYSAVIRSTSLRIASAGHARRSDIEPACWDCTVNVANLFGLLLPSFSRELNSKSRVVGIGSWQTGQGLWGVCPSPNTRWVISHRFAYEYFVGPIPDGMQIHHLCGNTSCCNPLHLTPVTPRENVMLSNGVTAQNARKTHCKRGHEFTPENIRWMKNGRACRECERLRMVSRELKRKGGGELMPNS